MNLAELVRAADQTALAAVDDRGQSLTYGELVVRARLVAEAIGPARTLVMLEGGATIDWLVAYVGCLLGRHPVMMVPAGDATTADRLAGIYQPAFRLAAADDFWPARQDGAGEAELHPELAVILSTSGSTGSAKCVRLSRANIAANARSIAEYLAIGADERGVVSLPTHYSYGLSLVNSHLAAGAALLLTARSVIEPEFWDFCGEHGATSFAGVPYSYELLQRIDLVAKAPPSLRYFTQAGGRLPAEQVRHFTQLAQANGWRFYVMYGQTEATARMAYLPLDKVETHADCIGVAIPGGRFELVDPIGQPIDAPLTEGELVYMGPNVMMGYAMGPADLALGAGPARLPTGDMAQRMVDGLYQITGRISRFVKIFGNRVGLDDVEKILERAGLAGVATGVDERLLVATRDAEAERAIIDLLTERLHLPADKITVRIVDDYPLLPTGKVDYASLKRALVAEIEREEWWSVRHEEPEDKAEAVRQLFADVFGSADDEEASFNARGGDSLTYISTVLALEPLIPNLPENWADLPLRDLVALTEAETTAAPSQLTVPKNLDTVRSVACLLVVALHVLGIDSEVGMHLPETSPWHIAMAVLTPVRLPLFTAMAGFLYALMPARRTGFVPFMRRKIDTLLWPLLFGTFVFWAVWVYGYGGQDSLLEMLRSGRPHFWYIHALLLWFLVVALLDTAVAMTGWMWLGLLVADVVVWQFIPHFKIIDDLFSPELFPFFILGMFLYRIPQLWTGKWQWALGLAVFVGYFMVTGWLPGLLDRHGTALFRLAASTGSIIFIMKCFPRLRFFDGLALYTFTIYLWHLPVIGRVGDILTGWGITSIPVQLVVQVFFGMTIPLLLHKVVERMPLAVRLPIIGR